VSSSLWDEVPHIFIPKSHLEPREFLISSAKRLLQQYRHITDKPPAPEFVGYWTNNGQRLVRALNGSVANDPKRTSVLHRSNRNIVEFYVVRGAMLVATATIRQTFQWRVYRSEE